MNGRLVKSKENIAVTESKYSKSMTKAQEKLRQSIAKAQPNYDKSTVNAKKSLKCTCIYYRI